MRQQLIDKFEANMVPKSATETKEKKKVPLRPKVPKVPKQQVETSGLYRGRRNPTTAGRAVRLQAAAAAAVTGTTITSVANRRPSFEGEYGHQGEYGENDGTDNVCLEFFTFVLIVCVQSFQTCAVDTVSWLVDQTAAFSRTRKTLPTVLPGLPTTTEWAFTTRRRRRAKQPRRPWLSANMALRNLFRPNPRLC